LGIRPIRIRHQEAFLLLSKSVNATFAFS